MQYAILNADGTYKAQAPEGNVYWDEDHFCTAGALGPEEAATFRVVPLLEVPPPAYDPLTRDCVRNGAELVNGQWQYAWLVTSVTADVAHQRALQDCRTKRRLAYPPMQDYLDGLVKGDTAQMAAYVSACLAVKAQFPKPV